MAAFATLLSVQADAQVTVSRTSKVIAGVSPVEDSLWTVNQADYSIVKRVHPTIPADDILGFNAIATDPVTGDHYSIANLNTAGLSLITINVQTGICALVGVLSDNVKSLAFNANGTLFGMTAGLAAMNAETVYKIDKSNAGLTIAFTVPVPDGADGVLTYNNDDNNFYHWSGSPATGQYESFDTTGVGFTTIGMTPPPASEVLGAMYDGSNNFIVSDDANTWSLWDATGNISPALITFNSPLRGLVSETHTSSISSSGPVAICPGSNVVLTVTGGTGGYQWYKDGSLLGGEIYDTLTVDNPGVYNCVYADVNSVIDSPTAGITVSFLETSPITVGAGASICYGTLTASVGFSTMSSYTSPSTYSFTVPADVTSIIFDVKGGAGGRDTSMMAMPGMGGMVTGALAVTPGDVLTINVGGAGADGTMGGVAGGFNGGGQSFGFGGSGGGATDIRLNGTAATDRVVVAGGGAGSGYDAVAGMSVFGGAGGDLTAGAGGINSEPSMAMGGDQTAGGTGAMFTSAASGSDGMLAMGGDGSTDGVSGGAGAGYYGGGGGVWSGGGGGSSYTDAMLVTGVAHTQGTNTGAGNAAIAYPVPSTYSYSIVWDAAAHTAGFTDVTAMAFPSSGSSFSVDIPATATPDTYNGTLYINNGICDAPHAISIEVKPIPTVNTTSNQAVCNGTATTDVMFAGAPSTPTFSWTNSKPSVGIAASGVGDIMSFSGTNTSTAIDTAMIIVTPELNGCYGTPDTFDIVVFPTPMLSVNPAYVCDGAPFNYTATSATAGAAFSWERTTVPAGVTTAAPSAAGTNTISETFDNTTADATQAVVPVSYTFTVTANGCDNTETLTANVNPTLTLYPTPLTGSICDGATFSYTQSNPIPGVIYTWSREGVTGIANPAASGTGNISESLDDTVTSPVTVTYVDTLSLNGCMNTQTLSVIVNPTPVLTSSLTPPSVCNNSVFDYDATSATAGVNITWSRAFVAGIATAAGTGPDTVNETHSNVTELPIPVVYDFTLEIDGCTNTQAVTVTVNPTAHLNTTLTPAAICDSGVFDYEPASNTPGATFAWSRAVVTNVTNPAAFGSGNPLETLRSTSGSPVVVTYTFTTTIDGCPNSGENVPVTVNPRPWLSNSSLSYTICDSALFSFSPASITTPTDFAWVRPFVPGIGATEGMGNGSITEVLKNNTSVDRTVQYIYTLSASGCSRMQTVDVTVHPTPKLTSLTDSACSGNTFTYTADGNVLVPVTYAWTRAQVIGITPNSGAGTGNISETLINETTAPLDVVYVYTLTVGGSCDYEYDLSVKVRPAAAAPEITTMPASSLCNNSMFQNFGAATPAASGNSYEWSATNAEIYGTGAGSQYALVSFTTPGTSVVTLTSMVGTTGCSGVATYTVNVSSESLDMPRVIWTNSSAFICLKNDVKSYQWGYDDATTLDSVILTNETHQSYFNKTPDFTNRYYWVIVDDGNCLKKAYYNSPDGSTPRITANEGNAMAIAMNVFPNPASDKVTVELQHADAGVMTVEVSNVLGQKVATQQADARKVSVDVTTMPAGIYVVDCYLDGAKVGTAKFVKN